MFSTYADRFQGSKMTYQQPGKTADGMHKSSPEWILISAFTRRLKICVKCLYQIP